MVGITEYAQTKTKVVLKGRALSFMLFARSTYVPDFFIENNAGGF